MKISSFNKVRINWLSFESSISNSSLDQSISSKIFFIISRMALVLAQNIIIILLLVCCTSLDATL